jgi:hypothetical protein
MLPGAAGNSLSSIPRWSMTVLMKGPMSSDIAAFYLPVVTQSQALPAKFSDSIESTSESYLKVPMQELPLLRSV